MGNWLRNFMAGRNGFDQLCLAQLAGAVLLNLLARWTDSVVLSLLGSGLLIWVLFRAYSRNLPRRQAENQRFLTAGSRIRGSYRSWRERQRHRKEYKFFRCGGCGNWLRVPRGKGKIQITCPRCGQRFSGRS